MTPNATPQTPNTLRPTRESTEWGRIWAAHARARAAAAPPAYRLVGGPFDGERHQVPLDWERPPFLSLPLDPAASPGNRYKPTLLAHYDRRNTKEGFPVQDEDRNLIYDFKEIT